MKIVKYALIVIVFLLLVIMFAGKRGVVSDVTPPINDNSAIASLCTDAGGTYDVQFSECLGVGAEQCTAIGGTFNECASACRNDPSAEFCTMQCVQVCEIP